MQLEKNNKVWVEWDEEDEATCWEKLLPSRWNIIVDGGWGKGYIYQVTNLYQN